MDNRKIDIVSEGKEDLRAALSIIWKNCPGGKATHFYVGKFKEEFNYVRGNNGVVTSHYSTNNECSDGTETLILLWHEEGKAIKLPFSLTLETSADFIDGWLGEVSYGREPDHDGDNGKGWRLLTDYWGHHYGIVGIQPTWAMYGK